MRRIKTKNKLDTIDRFGFVMLCALMADCCITGAGRLVLFGGISLRMILLALTLVAAAPLMLSDWRALLKNKLIWALGLWVFWLAVTTVIGVAGGNNRSLIITDLKGFAYFSLVPAAICLLRTKERVLTLMKVMIYASGVLGILVLIHFALYLWNGEMFMKLYIFGLERGFSGISPISATMPRLFFKSSNYFLVGCAFATYLQAAEGKFRLDYTLITGISLVCLLMTYTRSVYLAVGIAAVILIVALVIFMPAQTKKRVWKHIGLSVLVFCLILSVFGIATKTDYVSYAIERTLLSLESGVLPPGPGDPSDPTDPSVTLPTLPGEDSYLQDTVSSDQLRAKIQVALRQMIRKSPIWGNGLGAAVEWRHVNEYFYMDLTAKTGFIGLILYLLPAALAVWMALKNRKALGENKAIACSWLCVLAGFLAFSYFNPYMNAALGVLFYSCTLGAVHAVAGEKTPQKTLETEDVIQKKEDIL